MRRRLYWYGAILYPVLQVDFWVAPHHSQLQRFALIGSTVLTCAYVADQVARYRTSIWRFLLSLRRD